MGILLDFTALPVSLFYESSQKIKKASSKIDGVDKLCTRNHSKSSKSAFSREIALNDVV
jgi:hypothetical protein